MKSSELDLFYDYVDRLMWDARFDRFDRVDALLGPDPSFYTTDQIVVLLTTTLPAASKLPSRGSFYARCVKVLSGRGEGDEVLTGLEGRSGDARHQA